MKEGIVIGIVCIILGIGVFAYYERFVKYEREAAQLVTEGKLLFERDSRESVNAAVNIFSRVVAHYKGTRAEKEAYYYIAQGYEKLDLNRLAYYKYVYLLKNRQDISRKDINEIKARIGRLKLMRRYTDEGVHQLMSLLNKTTDRDFRSRVYTELGHAYMANVNYRQAKSMFEIALTENGDNEEAMIGQARSMIRLGEHDQAYAVYDRYLKYYGNFSRYADDVRRSYRGQLYHSGLGSFRHGDYPGARNYFNRLIRQFPDDTRSENSLYWIGESHFAQGRYDTAINYYNRVLSNGHSHKDEDARIKKAYAYFNSKKFDLAAREFQVYLNTYPKGRYRSTAKKWKDIARREILYRLRDDSTITPDPKEKDYDDSVYDDDEDDRTSRAMKKRGTGGRVEDDTADDDYRNENMAEL